MGTGIALNLGIFGDLSPQILKFQGYPENPRSVLWTEILQENVLGFIPEIPRFLGMGTGLELFIGLGILWGQGKLKLWGFWGENPKKSPNFGAGTGERISGIFTTLMGKQVATM